MKFDIVTPSFNQGPYIRQTIESVLAQEVAGVDLAYFVLDGGSTDESIDIIRSYQSRLKYWRSEKDGGQSAAIAEGLAMGNGDIVAWINSDDYYPDGAFRKVADFFSAHPDVDVVYGDCLLVDAYSNHVGLGTHVPVTWLDLYETPYLINQESTFFRRALYESVGGVNPSYWGAMDYDLWLRLFREGRAAYLPEVLGVHRVLDGQKSSSSVRYVEEMRRARTSFSQHYSVAASKWPYSEIGRQRILDAWEQRWGPVREWIKNGCIEGSFEETVRDLWGRYSRSGILPVQGTTSFGWIGPDSLYVIDQEVVGDSIDWVFAAPFPDHSVQSLELNLEGSRSTIEIAQPVSLKLTMPRNKRFVTLRITAEKFLVPADENWGPAYFSLSAVSCPMPKGKQIISIQSAPNMPKAGYWRECDSVAHTSVGSAQNADTRSNDGDRANIRMFKPKRRRLRIALFSAHTAKVGSGCEHLIYNTAKGLIARGHDVRVYVMNASLDDNPPSFVRQLPTFPLERSLERKIAGLTGWNDCFFPSTALLRFYPWLHSADIWHFHNLHAHYISMPILGLLTWTKRVILSPVDQFLSTGYCPYTIGCERYRQGCGSCPRISEAYPGISRDATRFLWKIKELFFRFSKVKLLVHTKALESHYRATFVGNRPIQVLRYGVDIHVNRKLQRESCAKHLGVVQGSRVVIGLFHSHISDERKGIVPIIRALDAYAIQAPDKLELLVVGHGSDAVRQMASPGMHVTALPFLKHPDDLANALNLCDVLLYPTRAENLSLTCLSALACGVPVVTYDAGGQKEAVINDVNGFVVPVDDANALLKALMLIVDDRELQQRLSAGARRTIEDLFDFDHYIDELVRYYYDDRH